MRYREIHMSPVIAVGMIAMTVAALSGCEREENASQTAGRPTAQKAAAELPDTLFVELAPDGARSIAEVKADTEASGKIVVKGRIGGRKNLFVDGAAIFLLADTSMKSCSDIDKDKCATPWDYCCEPPDSLNAKVATVQIIGDDGRPLRVDVQGRNGLKPLATIVVSGEIVRQSGSGALVINAEHIHVESEGG